MTIGRTKRIGLFVAGAFASRDRVGDISGHVQIPLMAAGILRRAGHEVALITTKERGADHLARECPEGLEVHTVQQASTWNPEYRLYVGKAIKQAGQLLALLKKQRFDIVHFFGGTGTAWLLGMLKSVGVSSTVFYTPIKEPPRPQSLWTGRVLRAAFRRVEAVLAMTDYVSGRWTPIVGTHRVRVMRPGVAHTHHQDGDPAVRRDSVLFWRCARYENGVDVAMASFRKLAGAHPDLHFVFAVRPHEPYETPLLELAASIENIDVHIYPYQNGISLPRLLARALVVVQPFRDLSINPQLVILESLWAGVPVVTTDIESNSELIDHESSGLLIPPGDERALSEAVGRLLSDSQLRTRLGRHAARMTPRRWNWETFGRQLLEAYDA